MKLVHLERDESFQAQRLGSKCPSVRRLWLVLHRKIGLRALSVADVADI